MKPKILVGLLFIGVATCEVVQVTTPDGPVNGITKETFSGKAYYAFYSIPYAKPPTGARRFLASESVDPHTEPHDGTTENQHVCYQFSSDSDAENEDCLHLNVFTPANQTGKQLPVMVNIHGGGFVDGNGLEGFIPSQYILEEDIIFVAMNYRLGVFGFLSTGDDVIPGNAGLSDQILALKWVQRNIEAFGGDSGRVTIMGQSAGGASVGYLILSPQAEGLFSGAILESGNPLCPWAYQRNHTEIAFKTGSMISSEFDTSRDSKKLLQVLQNATAKEIDSAAQTFFQNDQAAPEAVQRSELEQGFCYTPSIDGDLGIDSPVLPQLQYEAFAEGNFNKVPTLMGISSEEGLVNLFKIDSMVQAYDENPARLNPQDMHISNEEDWIKVGNLIKEEYAPKTSFQNNELGSIQYFTDQDFAKSVTKQAELQSLHSDVYFYQFSYSGGRDGFPGSGNVSHVGEQGYIFSTYPPSIYQGNDLVIHDMLVRIWSNFAKYGNPTPEKEELLQNKIWPAITAETGFSYMNIGNFSETDLSIVSGKPKAERMAFWDSLYDKYGNRPFEAY